MTHDDLCELDHVCRECTAWVSQVSRHCHCGSRAYPLCKGCRDGRHLNHAATEPSNGRTCVCDLCASGVAA